MTASLLTYEQRLEAMRERDSATCGMCDHKCVSHASYDTAETFVGIGRGMCGITGCGCLQFADHTRPDVSSVARVGASDRAAGERR